MKRIIISGIFLVMMCVLCGFAMCGCTRQTGRDGADWTDCTQTDEIETDAKKDEDPGKETDAEKDADCEKNDYTYWEAVLTDLPLPNTYPSQMFGPYHVIFTEERQVSLYNRLTGEIDFCFSPDQFEAPEKYNFRMTMWKDDAPDLNNPDKTYDQFMQAFLQGLDEWGAWFDGHFLVALYEHPVTYQQPVLIFEKVGDRFIARYEDLFITTGITVVTDQCVLRGARGGLGSNEIQFVGTLFVEDGVIATGYIYYPLPVVYDIDATIVLDGYQTEDGTFIIPIWTQRYGEELNKDLFSVVSDDGKNWFLQYDGIKEPIELLNEMFRRFIEYENAIE